ncbi:SDR family NAD(P)-dependent oxidoreductase [Actinoplanes sp. NPDC026619]|uniref:SDR family NAD(P)-dependent oxidoreductase n=1 Tax=Actinoplanes sp. NPDC026619 TaxID=3155798 RepID=UPI0033D8CE33
MGHELDGKRAIVTGGGTGIGYAVALELARQGAQVAIAGRRTEVLAAAATKIKDEIGADVLPVTADTGDDESVKALAETVKAAFGGVDILVNNAAEQPAQHGSSYLDATDDWFQRQINVKVIGYLRTIRAVAPLLIENGWGRIINISGTGSRQTVSVIGSVRNAGVTALTKNVADELGKHGINVTVVPEQIADSIEHWFRTRAADGFNLNFDVFPTGLELFVDHVVPLLRQRGIFRREYTGRTLRDHLGLPRPLSRFQEAEQ